MAWTTDKSEAQILRENMQIIMNHLYWQSQQNWEEMRRQAPSSVDKYYGPMSKNRPPAHSFVEVMRGVRPSKIRKPNPFESSEQEEQEAINELVTHALRKKK